MSLTLTLVSQEIKHDESLLFLMAARNAAKAGWTKKAIQRYEAYLKQAPGDYVVELEFADFLQNSGHYRKAEIHYDKLREKLGSVTEGKNDFAWNLNLSAARNAIKNKKNDRAVEYYKQVLLSDGRDLKVAEEIAGVFAGLEKFDDVLELCEKILLNDPQNLEVLTLKTNLLVPSQPLPGTGGVVRRPGWGIVDLGGPAWLHKVYIQSRLYGNPDKITIV